MMITNYAFPIAKSNKTKYHILSSPNASIEDPIWIPAK